MDKLEQGNMDIYCSIDNLLKDINDHSKTHTMEGDINSEDDAGIVPRAVKAILEQLESSGAEFTIRVSFLELCKCSWDSYVSVHVSILTMRFTQIMKSYKTY